MFADDWESKNKTIEVKLKKSLKAGFSYEKSNVFLNLSLNLARDFHPEKAIFVNEYNDSIIVKFIRDSCHKIEFGRVDERSYKKIKISTTDEDFFANSLIKVIFFSSETRTIKFKISQKKGENFRRVSKVFWSKSKKEIVDYNLRLRLKREKEEIERRETFLRELILGFEKVRLDFERIYNEPRYYNQNKLKPLNDSLVFFVEAIIREFPGYIDLPILLSETGLSSLNVRNNKMALKYLNYVVDSFPTHQLVPQSMYFIGRTREVLLRDIDGAKDTYIRLVRTFSTSVWARSASNALKSIGRFVIDVDLNTYISVIIGNQEWMAENLRTTKYSDGTAIPNVTDKDEWTYLNTGAWSHYYTYNIQYDSLYGKLYNFPAVATEKLCPTGWHVPTVAEWNVLTDYLAANGRSGKEGTALKSTSGWMNNGNGTDDYRWNGLPGGYRSYDGNFNNNGFGYWWTSSGGPLGRPYFRTLANNNDKLLSGSDCLQSAGHSVRCLKD